MELIANWKDSWKFISQGLTAFTGVIDLVYANSAQVQGILTPGQFATFNSVMAVLIVISRVVKQNIPVTPEVKEALVVHAETLPEKAPT